MIKSNFQFFYNFRNSFIIDWNHGWNLSRSIFKCHRVSKERMGLYLITLNTCPSIVFRILGNVLTIVFFFLQVHNISWRLSLDSQRANNLLFSGIQFSYLFSNYVIPVVSSTFQTLNHM